MSASKASAAFLIVGMLLFGTINTVMSKLQNSSWSVGIDGIPKPFSKPWFQTLVMFTGEALCLAFFGIQQWRAKRREASGVINEGEGDPLLSMPKDDVLQDSGKKANLLVFWGPAALDLVGTTLGNIGLLWTVASVYQMLRGSVIIFTGILSVLFLKRRLNINNYTGMSITAGGIVLVGLSSMLSKPAGSGSHLVLLGDALVVAGILCNAIQMVIEEVLLKTRSVPPPQLVGMEGIFGMLMMGAVVLPAVYYIPGPEGQGIHENVLDAFVMLGNNGWLLAFVLCFFFSIAFFNFFALSIARVLTTVHRTFIDALRTVSVWVIQLILFYASNGSWGEPWNPYSYLQLIGFAMMVVGTLFYNQIIRLPIPDRLLPACCLPLPKTEYTAIEAEA